MKTDQLCFWLMGFLEMAEPEEGLNEKQTQTLKNHLNMVFEHIVNEDGTLKDEASPEIDALDLRFVPGEFSSQNC